MIKLAVIQDNDIWDDIKELPNEARRLFMPIFESEGLPKINALIAKTIGADPGPVKKPIEWQTQKQRRAFFATNGFGKGIPTKRTGKVNRGWQIKIDRRRKNPVVELVNYVSYAGYVYPDIYMNGSYRQQKFHRNTGWGRNLENQVIEVSEAVRDESISAYSKAVDQARENLGI